MWERLLTMPQERGVALGMALLDGTAVRAHQKAAGRQAKKARRAPRLRHRAAGLAVASAQRLRDRRRRRAGGRLCALARAGSRAAPGRAAAGTPARCAALSGGGLGLQLPRVPPARLRSRRPARCAQQAQRGARGLPRLSLRQQTARGEPVGPAEGMARRRHPVRENRHLVPRRPPPRRRARLAQALTVFRAVVLCRSAVAFDACFVPRLPERP